MFNVTLADEDTCPNVVVDVIDLDIALADSWKRFVDSLRQFCVSFIFFQKKLDHRLTTV